VALLSQVDESSAGSLAFSCLTSCVFSSFSWFSSRCSAFTRFTHHSSRSWSFSSAYPFPVSCLTISYSMHSSVSPSLNNSSFLDPHIISILKSQASYLLWLFVRIIQVLSIRICKWRSPTKSTMAEAFIPFASTQVITMRLSCTC
jgi:hypothetical protein